MEGTTYTPSKVYIRNFSLPILCFLTPELFNSPILSPRPLMKCLLPHKHCLCQWQRRNVRLCAVPNPPYRMAGGQEEFPIRDLPTGYGPSATASSSARPPTVTTLRYNASPSDSKGTAEVIVCGCDDGAVTVRPTIAPIVYARVQAHDSDASVTGAACSYDGEWIVSSDSDGLLAVHRCKRRSFEVSNSLGEDQWLVRLGEHSRGLLLPMVLPAVLSSTHDGK